MLIQLYKKIKKDLKRHHYLVFKEQELLFNLRPDQTNVKPFIVRTGSPKESLFIEIWSWNVKQFSDYEQKNWIYVYVIKSFVISTSYRNNRYAFEFLRITGHKIISKKHSKHLCSPIRDVGKAFFSPEGFEKSSA